MQDDNPETPSIEIPVVKPQTEPLIEDPQPPVPEEIPYPESGLSSLLLEAYAALDRLLKTGLKTNHIAILIADDITLRTKRGAPYTWHQKKEITMQVLLHLQRISSEIRRGDKQ